MIFSAVLHAGWNFFGQRSAPATAYFFIAITFAALITLPVVFIYAPAVAKFPISIWLLLAATGAFQALAYTGLSGAYRRGDLSLTYPLARAVPIPLIAAAGLLLGKAQAFSPTGLIGMLLVAVGCLILPLRDLRQVSWKDYIQPATLMALVAAAGIVGYTLVDAEAMRQLRQMPALGLNSLSLALVYLEYETLFSAAVLGIYVLIRPTERQRLRDLLRRGRSHLSIALATGFVLNLSYILILLAMGFARDVAYVVAFRQLSIPLGATLGMVVQKEPAFIPKMAGIVIVSIGLVLVGLG